MCKIYSEFHGFRSQVARRLFLSQLWPLLMRAPLFEAAEAVAKIGSSLKLNHYLANLACLNWWNTLYKLSCAIDFSLKVCEKELKYQKIFAQKSHATRNHVGKIDFQGDLMGWDLTRRKIIWTSLLVYN